MKKIFVGAAMAAAFVTPGIASADTQGYVGLGFASLDNSDDGDVEDLVTLDGAVSTDLGGAWNLGFSASNADMGHGDHSHTYTSIDAQLFTNTDTYSFGAYVGNTLGELYGVGVGGAYYMGQFTIGGDVSYAQDRYDADYPVTTWSLNGGYYINDNFVVNAEYGYTDSEWEGEEGDLWGIGAEYRFADSPFSVSANFTSMEGDSSETEAFGIGVRYNFGSSDLITRDRTGAMNGFRDVARNHALLC